MYAPFFDFVAQPSNPWHLGSSVFAVYNHAVEACNWRVRIITKDAWNSAFCLTNDVIIAWLERQFWNQTFDDDVKVDIDEIREVLGVDDGVAE